MSIYKLKPEVLEAFNSLPPEARKALDVLLEGVEGKSEYVEEHQDDYGSFDADYGLTDWDIDISERADGLISALSDLWDECRFCGQEIVLTTSSAPIKWVGNSDCPTYGGHLPKGEDE